MDTTAQTKARRHYNRRTEDERIADLDRRIADLKARQATREKKDDPVLREIPKIQRRLRKFAQLAMDHNRPDISNSILAFNAGMERLLHSEIAATPRRAASGVEEDGADDRPGR